MFMRHTHTHTHTHTHQYTPVEEDYCSGGEQSGGMGADDAGDGAG
jgi:hypothetical protein